VPPESPRILTVNTGSSSVKLAVFEGERRAETEHVERLAAPADHAEAAAAFLARVGAESLDGAGHRVVHGGERLVRPVRVDAGVLAELRRVEPLAPAHMPQALAALEALLDAAPGLPQVACFDTAFHATLPPVARLLPLPRALAAEGVRRYGFHGLSYESVLARLEKLDPDAAAGRLLVAHLGHGASMAAVREGECVETTMGFTPAGGLVMGTRPGDLDPGVLVHLLRTRGLGAEGLDRLLNERSGLLGVSELSSDMADLLASDDPRAAEAVELFCRQALKFAGALAAVLGGLDALVFTGGIGENAAEVRRRICLGLAHLGVELDEVANAAGEPLVSRAGSAVTVRVVAADEEVVIARHAAAAI
jgi:acetate kinase